MACSAQKNPVKKVLNDSQNEDLKAKQWVDSIYTSLSLEDKIGQLFIISAYTNKDAAHVKFVNEAVEKEHIGGLILMQDDALKQLQWVKQLQNKSKIPLLIGIDGEWGLAQRFKNTTKYPWAMTLGALQDNSLITEMAKTIALDCKRMGIHWDFAPVVDINTNPKNPIIGNRSFGSDKNLVTEKALAYMNGLQSQNIFSSAKHFPGHGDTDVDSHLDLPVVKHSKERLDSLELFPFKKLISEGVKGIMVAHLNVPSYEKDPKIPASLSYNIVTELLKNQLNYKGLIITDALNMQGVAKNFSPGEIDLLAFKAGNDILLFSQNPSEGKEKIKKALQNGEIPMERLEESVKKILYAKYWVGLNHFKNDISEENLSQDLNKKENETLKAKIYQKAITVVKQTDKNLKFHAHKKYLFVALDKGNSDIFYSELKNKFPNLLKVSASELNPKKYNPKDYEVILGVFKDTETTAYYSYKLDKETQNSISKSSLNYSTTLILFQSPYGLLDIDTKPLKNIIVTYQNNDFTQQSCAEILEGKIKAEGKLPVALNLK